VVRDADIENLEPLNSKAMASTVQSSSSRSVDRIAALLEDDLVPLEYAEIQLEAMRRLGGYVEVSRVAL
jgi:hypothetical protein